MDLIKQFDNIGKDYISGQEKFFSNRADKAREFIAKCLPDLKDKKILDLGCGHGKDIRIYEELGAEVYGIDASEIMIDEAKQNVNHPERLFLGNFESTPFEEKYFDVIIGRHSMHFLDSFDNVYKEMARILKKKGIFILVVQHPIKDLFLQESKLYGDKEIIKVTLYNEKVPVYFPTHTFKEWFSEEFFKNFYIDFIDEEYRPKEYRIQGRGPAFLAFKAIRR